MAAKLPDRNDAALLGGVVLIAVGAWQINPNAFYGFVIVAGLALIVAAIRAQQ